MHRHDADPNNLQMSDVLCDFCRRPWSIDVPLVEGHRGAAICGDCLAAAYTDVELAGGGLPANEAYTCVLCREDDRDRAALGRAGERGWRGGAGEKAAICRRCIVQAGGVLHRDGDYDWRLPSAS